ncbi:hypothetical protein O181_097898 [Austropuccinia psidii MF-1]|uniref:Uncharacterized protein n=1 Tax=Austropuccinia psidii MF-1 TaxID=1389203 RepID=A0A9Q3PDL9_9BASI|nr:hypothetical protein [Austropuccinia psidii MF-1]
MDTALLIWNTVVSWTVIFKNIISDRNPKLPQDFLRKDLIEIHPTAARFKGMLAKARKHAVRCMEDSFAYAKDNSDKSHVTPDYKVGDLVLVSTTNFNNIK